MRETPIPSPTSRGIRVAVGAWWRIAPLLVVALAAPSSARAETGVPFDACSSTYVKVEATLPANAPGLFVGVGASMTTNLQLRAAGGALVATTLDASPGGPWRTLKIDEPLTEGVTYTLSWEDCAGLGAKSFVATAAKPLPTTAGTLAVGAFSGPSECDSSGTPTGFRAADVELLLDPAVEPFAAIATMVLTVDAESAGGGGIYPSGGKYVGSLGYKCPFIAPVVHAVGHVVIPGMAPVDSPAVAITTTCPAAGSAPCASGEPDASVDDGATSPANSSATSSGCSVGAAPASASLSMLSMLAVAGVLLRRRRASRRSL